MDSSQRALQTNEKVFFFLHFEFVYEFSPENRKNIQHNNKVGFMQARWIGICADQYAF